MAAVPATSANLRISEIHYHPADPSADEEDADFNSDTDFEFIELVNVGSETFDLSDAELQEIMVDDQDQGVAFDFSTGAITELAPGERVLVVEDVEAFALRYGDGLPVAGQWSGSLSNRGEILTLVVDGATVHQFAYDDVWQETTDGDGPSLEIANPTSGDLQSWSQARSWRASQPVGGTPGRGTFGDLDGDERVGPKTSISSSPKS